MADEHRGRWQNVLHWFDIVSKFLLGVAGLVLSGSIGYAALYNNQRAADRQVQNQAAALAAQREIAGAQAATALLPLIIKGSDIERGAAEDILLSIAPDQLRSIAARRAAQATTPSARLADQRTVSATLDREREIAFYQHLDNARKYRGFNLSPEAAREFIAAGATVPASVADRVPRNALDEGRRLYDNGRFAEAAAKLDDAFAKVTVPGSAP